MQINPGSSNFMPSQPSHATLTIESINSETDERTKKRFRCRFEGCPRTYSSAGNLKAHIKSHTGKNNNGFYENTFVKQSYLYRRVHFQVH